MWNKSKGPFINWEGGIKTFGCIMLDIMLFLGWNVNCRIALDVSQSKINYDSFWLVLWRTLAHIPPSHHSFSPSQALQRPYRNIINSALWSQPSNSHTWYTLCPLEVEDFSPLGLRWFPQYRIYIILIRRPCHLISGLWSIIKGKISLRSWSNISYV